MNNSFRCVIDANVGIKRFISDPLTAKSRQLFDTLNNPQTEIFIPDLFYIEIANIFWKYVRAELYSASQVQTDLSILKQFPLKVVSTSELMEEAIDIAIVHEMVHLIEHRHNKEFWYRVERVLPDYLERKQWLAENGVKYDL